VESALRAEGRELTEATLDEMERHWQQAKGSDPRSEEKPR
jgi:uncharacterized protein YabN with tetrapyrrole methylase and pyrophosphatase domain